MVSMVNILPIVLMSVGMNRMAIRRKRRRKATRKIALQEENLW
jgi:preprotein translocase subunit YajC